MCPRRPIHQRWPVNFDNANTTADFRERDRCGYWHRDPRRNHVPVLAMTARHVNSTREARTSEQLLHDAGATSAMGCAPSYHLAYQSPGSVPVLAVKR
jgi:hypothetical protein